jgi:hypothetical protein
MTWSRDAGVSGRLGLSKVKKARCLERHFHSGKDSRPIQGNNPPRDPGQRTKILNLWGLKPLWTCPDGRTPQCLQLVTRFTKERFTKEDDLQAPSRPHSSNGLVPRSQHILPDLKGKPA